MSLIVGAGVIDWMREHSGGEYRAREATGLGWQDGRRLVAGVAYTDFNGANVAMHVVALPGARWLRRTYLWACFDYPFNQLKVSRVTGIVAAGNRAARAFDEHLGFTLEATLERAHPSGALLVYRMFREECRWIASDFAERASRQAA